jgi:hypothetical protein
MDPFGVFHHVFEAVLVAPPGRNCFGRMDIYEDSVHLAGVDLMRSFKVNYRKDAIKIKGTKALETPK